MLLLFFQWHNIAACHLCRLNVSLAVHVFFHPSHGGTGRRRRRLLLSNGCSVDHWALVTALTPFWRCRESDQRDCVLRPRPSPVQPCRRSILRSSAGQPTSMVLCPGRWLISAPSAFTGMTGCAPGGAEAFPCAKDGCGSAL